jgi:hypothetical protein
MTTAANGCVYYCTAVLFHLPHLGIWHLSDELNSMEGDSLRSRNASDTFRLQVYNNLKHWIQHRIQACLWLPLKTFTRDCKYSVVWPPLVQPAERRHKSGGNLIAPLDATGSTQPVACRLQRCSRRSTDKKWNCYICSGRITRFMR